MKTAVINGKVITPFSKINNGGVLIENDIITDVFDGTFKECADRVIDVEGNYISPGFIDIHTHGAGGYDFMDGTAESFIGAAKAHMVHGTTSLVSTTLSSSDIELLNAFECYKKAKARMKDGPNLLGIHLEGPYFAPSQAGAQDPKHLKLPEREHYLRLLNASDDIIRVSAAPELPGALELGDELRKRGILASMGHTDAIYDQAEKAFLHGYTHITHLYSATSMLRRIGPYRHLGVVEAAYMIDGITIEIIADGKHLPSDLLKYIVRFKAIDKICLVTDSMRGAGLPDGAIVKLGSLENGQDVILEDGVAMLMDRTAFAGSVCTADRCIRTISDIAGVPLENAVMMMTANPARIIGAKNKGTLAPGMDADICIFDDDVNIKKVFVAGRQYYGH